MNANYRKSVFIVIYSREKNKIEYLLLKRKRHWKGWEFPKEGVEKNEREEETVGRGIREETGLQIIGKIQKFNIYGKYRYGKKLSDRPGFIGQSYSLYACEINKGKVKLDEHEHSTYEWLEYDDAIKRLTWKNQKQSLEIVNANLTYKSFRKIITKNGILILGGKDENSNEELVKQSAPDELVFHTVAAGSPFVNIKGKANENDIKEAAIFCAKFSRDWKQNKKDIYVNIFHGRDIYKKAGMKTGTFGVKNFKTIKVRKEEIEKFNAPSGN